MFTSLAPRLAVAATQAPSVRNTQPWRFTASGADVFELLADWDRRLPVTNPRGRSGYGPPVPRARRRALEEVRHD